MKKTIYSFLLALTLAFGFIANDGQDVASNSDTPLVEEVIQPEYENASCPGGAGGGGGNCTG